MPSMKDSDSDSSTSSSSCSSYPLDKYLIADLFERPLNMEFVSDRKPSKFEDPDESKSYETSIEFWFSYDGTFFNKSYFTTFLPESNFLLDSTVVKCVD